jgi:hypothetical protein
MLPAWPALEVGATVVWWSFGPSTRANRDPFDASIWPHIVVQVGVVTGHGRLDVVVVALLDGEANSNSTIRVKRCELRRVVARRHGATGPGGAAAAPRRARMSMKFGDKMLAAAAASEAPVVRVIPASVGIGHAHAELTLEFSDIK